MHAARRTPQLVGERGYAHRQGIRVGHLEDGSDAAHHGGARARLEVLLVLAARLAKMHLRVDHPRQDMQPTRVDDLAGVGAEEVVHCGDPAVAHADVPLADAVMVDDHAATEDQVEGRGHSLSPGRKVDLQLPAANMTLSYLANGVEVSMRSNKPISVTLGDLQ